MGFATIFILAVALSMDAFAVSICKGLAMQEIKIKECFIVALWFGGFQGLMPLIGYILGVQFERYINAVAPWIAFGLLSLIGINMVKESFSKEEEEETASLGIGEMAVLAVATSIDALAVGVSFACVPVKIAGQLNTFLNTVIACLMITVVTGILSSIGLKVGNLFGSKYKNKAELAGGIILIGIGIKILAEHLLEG